MGRPQERHAGPYKAWKIFVIIISALQFKFLLSFFLYLACQGALIVFIARKVPCSCIQNPSWPFRKVLASGLAKLLKDKIAKEDAVFAMSYLCLEQ